jgi:hypothetical protein
MELRAEHYVVVLLMISLGLFFYIGWWLKMDEAEAYKNLLLTIAVVHFVMSKIVAIKVRK